MNDNFIDDLREAEYGDISCDTFSFFETLREISPLIYNLYNNGGGSLVSSWIALTERIYITIEGRSKKSFTSCNLLFDNPSIGKKVIMGNILIYIIRNKELIHFELL